LTRRLAPTILQSMQSHLDVWTERLLIRPFSSSDLDAMAGWMGDPAVTTFLGGVLTRDEAAERLAASIAAFERMQPLGSRAVTLLENPGDAIGYCGLGILPHSPERHIELFAGFRRTAWGRGYAAEASQAMIRLAFDQLGLHQVVAAVNPGNERSVRLVTRLGFQQRGTMPWPDQGTVGLFVLPRPSSTPSLRTPWPEAR